MTEREKEKRGDRRRQKGKSSRGCCSHVHLPTPAATLHPYPHPSLACSLICLTSSFVHRTSSGMAVKWCARLACGTVGPCKLFTCIHLAPIHPHTHPHTCRDTHPYARAQTWHPVMPVVSVNSVFKSECLLQLGLQGSISDCFWLALLIVELKWFPNSENSHMATLILYFFDLNLNTFGFWDFMMGLFLYRVH